MNKKIDFDIEDRVGKLREDYERAVAYQGTLGMTVDFPKFVKFFEGKQWPRATKNTKNLPRPVINFTKMICRNKKSAILAKRLRLVYKAENAEVDVTKFNEFAAYVMKELGQEQLDKECVDDGVKKGPYCYHYYWDADARGKDALSDGALRCERIDPLNVFFANPKEKDEQKQRWIMISSREEVSSVRQKADSDVDIDSICADESDDSYGNTEQEGEKLCTVLTRYFRIGGEVYCEIGTKNAIVRKPFPIAPDVEAAKEYLGYVDEEPYDAPGSTLPDGEKSETPERPVVRAPLYPVVMGAYEQREGSIYGIGEIEGLIPNQKAVNFQFAMSLLNAQELAWGKYVVHPQALKGQTITNEPAQVLTDYSGTGNGIKKLSEQPLQGEPTKLASEIIQLSRSMAGSSEVMSGEIVGANMSGAAIAQLQATATQPIEELADNFRLVKEKQGRVIAQFLKLYYIKKPFVYEREEQKLALDGTPIMNALGKPETEKVRHSDVFSSSEFESVDFDVVAEAVSGTKASAAGDIQLLESLFSQGKISLVTFIELYPDEALSNKQELLRIAREEEESMIAELTRAIEEARAQIAQYESTIANQQKTVDSVVAVINENNNLKRLLAELYTEASEKLALANAQIKQGNATINETYSDAQLFANELARDRGYIS